MFPGSNVFEAGHRMRVEVSSSNFPNLARIPETREEFGHDKRDARRATRRCTHSAQYPSHIVLPVDSARRHATLALTPARYLAPEIRR